MKKKLFLISLIGLICATSAYAACEGGTMVGGFCKSNVQMNWWSAAAWCKANGLQLASMYEMCPSWDGQSGLSGMCSELNGKDSGYAWSATACDSSNAFAVNLSSGRVESYYRTETYRGDGGPYAFCR